MSDEPRRSGVRSGARPHEPGQSGHRGEAEEPKQLVQLEPAEQPSQEPGQLEQLRQRRQHERSGHREPAGHRDRPAPPAPGTDLEQPSQAAALEVQKEEFKLKMYAQGPLALGAIGPTGVILVGYPVGLPVWAIVAISTLQIVASIVMARTGRAARTTARSE